MKTNLQKRTPILGFVIYICEILACLLMAKSVYAADTEDMVSDNTCRVKAKKVAIKIYSECMAEERKTALEEIKNQYKDELRELKKKFDSKAKKMNEGWDSMEEIEGNKQPPAPPKEEPAPVKDFGWEPITEPFSKSNPNVDAKSSSIVNSPSNSPFITPSGPARFPQFPLRESSPLPSSTPVTPQMPAQGRIPKVLPKKTMGNTFRDSKKEIPTASNPVVVFESPMETPP